MKDSGFTFLVAVFVLAVGPERVLAQASPCLTNADTAALYAQSVTRDITVGDSTRLVNQGLPYRPAAGVSLVADSLICQSVVDAYNALDTMPASPARISRAYVMRVGSTAYAMVGESNRSLFFYFDTSYHWLASFVWMR